MGHHHLPTHTHTHKNEDVIQKNPFEYLSLTAKSIALHTVPISFASIDNSAWPKKKLHHLFMKSTA
jgi:hypothetical protein